MSALKIVVFTAGLALCVTAAYLHFTGEVSPTEADSSDTETSAGPEEVSTVEPTTGTPGNPGDPANPSDPADPNDPGSIPTPTGPSPNVQNRTAENALLSMDLRFDHDLVLPEDVDAFALLEVRAAENATTERTPVAMTLIMDVSGSMEGEKLDGSLMAATQLVDRLADGDRISLIAFNHEAETVLSDVVLGPDRSAIHETILGLEAGGNTCISCGYEAALELPRAPTTHQSRVVVMSDGIDNESERAPELYARDFMQLRDVVSTAIGFGRDADEAMMGRIAENGTGMYYFMHHESMLADILDTEMASLAATILTGLRLTFTPGSGSAIGNHSIVGATPDGNRLVVNVGQMSIGEQRRFLIPINLPSTDLGSILSADAVFTDLTGTGHNLTVDGAIMRTADPSAVAGSADPLVISEQTRLQSLEDMTAALDLFEAGETDRALNMLRDNERSIRQRGLDLDDDSLGDEANELGLVIDRLEVMEPESPEAEGTIMLNRSRRQQANSGRAPEAAPMQSNDMVDPYMTR